MPELKVVSTGTRRKVSDRVVERSRVKTDKAENAFVIPQFPKSALPPGVKSADKHPLAMDSQIIEVNAWAAQSMYAGAFNNGATFLGYPYLSQLAQVPEYRKIVETTAMHMTRKFISLQSIGDKEGADKADKIKAINDDLENFRVRDVFRHAAEVDGYFGRAHLYIDLGEPVDKKELTYTIGNGRDAISRLKVEKGTLKGFKIIEPVWTYPSSYNSNNPLTGDWYNPQSWFVLGKELHVTRCLRMVGHEVPDLLKPAYAFGGLSMTQMAKPYVDNWLRTRQAVADTVWSFSVSGVSTDLATIMQGQGDELFARAELFNNLRNNRGLMMLNKDTEEFFQVNTPLGTLDKLQAQAQEHMASVSSIPLVFLLGITPSGLNASSEGEIRVFYDFIESYQNKFFKEPLTRVIDFIQLNRWGEIDPEITFKFEPLWSMTDKELAEVDKMEAETDDLRINGGVISPLEARVRLAHSPETPYAELDVTVIPIAPGSQDMNDDGIIEPGEEEPIGGEGLDPGKPSDGGGVDDKPHKWDEEGNPFAADNAFAWDFEESKHPRGQPKNAGQFAKGVSGSKVTPAIRPTYAATANHGYGSQVTKNGMRHKGFSEESAAENYAKTMNEASQEDHDQMLKNHYADNMRRNFEGLGIQHFDKFDPKEQEKLLNLEHLEPDFQGMNFNAAKSSPLVLDKTLTPTEGAIIAAYTGAEWKKTNRALRKGKIDTHSNEFAQNLNDALEKIPPFKGTTHRVVKFGPKELEGLMPGATLTDRGFFSTSKDNNMKSKGIKGNVTMEIHGTTGRDISSLSHSKYEEEVLYPANSRFEVVSRNDASDGKIHVVLKQLSGNQAHDEAHFEESKHPRGQPGNAGQFGPGGGKSSSSAAASVHKHAESLMKKTAGISGKYRQGIQNILKANPELPGHIKIGLKMKLIESYSLKSAQLEKNGDPKAKAVAMKAAKLAKALGTSTPIVKPSDVSFSKPDPASPEELKKKYGENVFSGPKHTVDKSHKYPDKYIVKTPSGEVVKNPGSSISMKFDTQAEAEAKAKEFDNQIKKPTAAPVVEEDKSEKIKSELSKKISNWSSMSDDDKASLADLASFTSSSAASSCLSEAADKLPIKNAPNLSAAKAAHIYAYTGSAYAKTNKQLRSNELDENTYNHVKQLNDALAALPKHTEVTTRGTDFEVDELKKWQPGKIVADHGFMSTTKKSEPSFGGNVSLTIHGKSGRDISGLSGHPGEKEVLFPSGTRFKVVSRTQSGGKAHITIQEV
jgi:phage-related protein (TIGR01555 family)